MPDVICQRTFPDNFPIQEAMHLYQHLRGNADASKCCISCCAWNIVGFGLGQAFACEDEQPLIGDECPEKLASMETSEILDTIHKSMEANSQVTFAADADLPPWLIPLLPYFAELARRFLENLLKR